MIPFPSIDEGDLEIACYIKSGSLIIHFGKDVSWLGFDTKEEVQLFIDGIQNQMKNMKS